VASEVRAALTRGATQRVARALPATPQRSSAADARRKRPARATDAPEVASTDTELEGLFATPEPAERRANGEGELEGMFPRDEPVTVGANGAPLPD
jgi:hypothetical protein